MKKIYALLLTATIPMLLLGLVYQVNRYADLKADCISLEKKQTQLLEKNKNLLTNIALVSAPERIEDIAINSLHLEKIKSENLSKIVIEKGKTE